MSSKGEGIFQTFSYGEFFRNESESACMLTLDMATRIAEKDTGSMIGKMLTLSYAASQKAQSGANADGIQVHRKEVQCRIAGIVERNPGAIGPGGALSVSGVMLTMGLARAIDEEIVTNAQSLLRDPGAAKTYAAITVKVKQSQYTQDVEDELRRMGFQAFSIDDALRGAKTAFIVLNIFLSLIGSIALTVSSLGIVNTMVMSILERTREIGIMKAIGASDNDIRWIFLGEASAIGLMGGLVGIALSWVVGRIINFGANIYIQNQGGTPGNLFSLPLWLIAGAWLRPTISPLSIWIGHETGSVASGLVRNLPDARIEPEQARRSSNSWSIALKMLPPPSMEMSLRRGKHAWMAAPLKTQTDRLHGRVFKSRTRCADVPAKGPRGPSCNQEICVECSILEHFGGCVAISLS